MPDTERIRICVVGATGRMGGTIIREAPSEKFEVTGAVAAAGEPGVGKSLKELGLSSSDLVVRGPDALDGLLASSDLCISFTAAQAELANLPKVVAARKPFVLGTTGFTESQHAQVVGALNGNVPTVMASNFSVGVNLLFAMVSSLKSLPDDFDISISEIHHAGKADAPSGTAKTLAEIVSKARGYSKTVYGRSGISKRSRDELEVSSFRGGGTPGEHTVYAFGPYEMLKLEHVAFSRSAFSQGALVAATWLSQGREPRVYSMLDVLGFKS